MKSVKKTIGLLFTVILILSMAGCSGEDPITDATKLLATISKIERQTPGGMNLTKEQANQLLEIIHPVVSGIPLTEDLAKNIADQTRDMLTKEQIKQIDETMASLGNPSGEGGIKNESGGGTGTPGSGGGTPGSSSGINMFLRLDEVITTNYLNQ